MAACPTLMATKDRHDPVTSRSHLSGKGHCPTTWGRIITRGDMVTRAGQRPRPPVTCIFFASVDLQYATRNAQTKQGWGQECTTPPSPPPLSPPRVGLPAACYDSPVGRAPNTLLLLREKGGSERSHHFLNVTQQKRAHKGWCSFRQEGKDPQPLSALSPFPWEHIPLSIPPEPSTRLQRGQSCWLPTYWPCKPRASALTSLWLSFPPITG